MPNVPKIVRERLEAVPPVASHPDANLLTAFAEHSLPERERTSVMEHLAQCRDCRDVVALASPEIEAAHAAPAPVRGGWFTWPAVRWGLVAAGILMIATFGIRQFQHQPGTAMVAKQETPQLQPPAAESHSSSSASGASASATRSEGGLKSDKGATNTLADSEDKNALSFVPKDRADLKVAPVPSVGSPTPGRTFGGTVRGVPHSGPAAPSQWPQQNAMNNSQNNFQYSNQAALPPASAKQQAAGAGAGGVIGPRRKSSVEVGNQAVALETSSPNLKAKDSDQAAQTQAQFQIYGALVKAKPPVPSVPSAPASNPKNEYDALLAAGKMQAQAGQMSGYVVDPSGAAVSNARVTITPSSGGPASAITDGQGRWLIAGLPSGSYLARAEAPGFKTIVQGLKYDAVHPSPYVFPLSIGNASETVEVAGENGLVQTTEARADSAVSDSQAAQLPLSGRNLSQLATLVSWTISPAGSLQRSLDQGKTWQDVDVTANVAGTYDRARAETNSQVAEKEVNKKALKRKMKPALVFRAVAATGTDVWAAGNAGALYHSTDAGNTWIPVVPASASAVLTGDIISLQFVDTQHGTVMTSTSEVWTTADRGQTWQKQ